MRNLSKMDTFKNRKKTLNKSTDNVWQWLNNETQLKKQNIIRYDS